MSQHALSLSACQEKALAVLREQKGNVFLTGHAGTGKSFLIREFLKDKDRKQFPVLASTGTAAVLLSGRTFHSYFGLGIFEGGVQSTIERALDNKRVVKRLREAQGFVLDEVSMISGPVLRAAEAIARLARKIHAPWGGLRVVATGDFAQLPPVGATTSRREWAFLDEVWTASEFVMLPLHTAMRTKDPEYLRVLQDVRVGQLSEDVRCYLNRKLDPESAQDEVAKATVLFPHRAPADQLNMSRLARLGTPLHEIQTQYTGEARALESLKKNAPIPELLQLKEGALVMIRINDPSYKYVNGTLATVQKVGKLTLGLELKNGRGLELEKHSFSLQDADGNVLASALNFPVSLAYATTIHKSQGATLDHMICDLRRLWEPGQAYVALSRLRSGDGLALLGWEESSIRTDPDVVAFYGLTDP